MRNKVPFSFSKLRHGGENFVFILFDLIKNQQLNQGFRFQCLTLLLANQANLISLIDVVLNATGSIFSLLINTNTRMSRTGDPARTAQVTSFKLAL